MHVTWVGAGDHVHCTLRAVGRVGGDPQPRRERDLHECPEDTWSRLRHRLDPAWKTSSSLHCLKHNPKSEPGRNRAQHWSSVVSASGRRGDAWKPASLGEPATRGAVRPDLAAGPGRPLLSPNPKEGPTTMRCAAASRQLPVLTGTCRTLSTTAWCPRRTNLPARHPGPGG